jgi:hypothetical protein
MWLAEAILVMAAHPRFHALAIPQEGEKRNHKLLVQACTQLRVALVTTGWAAVGKVPRISYA